MDAILTNANPGGTSFTVATFSNSGQDSIVSVKLLHSMNTGEFFKTPQTGPPLSKSELETLRGYGWTQANVSILGDFGATFSSLVTTHIDSLAAQGRTTNLTKQNLYDWLFSVWPSLRTYFVHSIKRQDAYSVSLLCPYPGPVTLVAEFSDVVSPAAPAYIPGLQLHVPQGIPFSSVAIADPNTSYVTHASSVVRYPLPGTHILSGTTMMLSADPGNQSSSTHRFTWYSRGHTALSGIQVGATYFNTDAAPLYIPITLLVTNLVTGISDASVTYIILEP